MLTRKAANAMVKQLQAQLAATTGETRKNLRARVARLADEVRAGQQAVTIRESLEQTIRTQAEILEQARKMMTTEQVEQFDALIAGRK